MRFSLWREFMRLEAAGGFLLPAAAILALILANSPLAWLYHGLLDVGITVQVGALNVAKPTTSGLAFSWDPYSPDSAAICCSLPSVPGGRPATLLNSPSLKGCKPR